MVRVEEHTTTIDNVPVFYRSAGALGSAGALENTGALGNMAAPGTAGTAAPESPATPLYLHEAITCSGDWTEFLEATGGLAPDLIGFGRSGKGGHLDYSPEGLTNFVAALLGLLAVERVKLVGHGWGGAIALLLALREPARVERLVLIDAVPLLPGFRWHRAARLWRRPLLGELAMGATTRGQLARQLRRAAARRDAWNDQRLGAIWAAFDQGTQRAILRLHRAADEPRLAELGTDLGRLQRPAQVIWGEHDTWFAPEFAAAYAELIPDATVELISDAGHWPWLDQPSVVERVAAFLSES